MKFLSLFKNNRKKKIKDKLEVSQEVNKLNITGIFEDHYYVTELWLFCREDGNKYKIAQQQPSNYFSFTISLDELLNLFVINGNKRTFDWFFKIRKLSTGISEKSSENVELLEINGEIFVEYFMRCGRFHQTDINNLSFYNKSSNFLINYITIQGNLSLAINHEPASPIKTQIEKVKTKNQKLYIEGKLFSRNSLITKIEVFVKGRDTGKGLSSTEIELEHLEKDTSSKYGLNRYKYKTTIDLLEINEQQTLPEDIYDLFFKMSLHDSHTERYLRIGRPTTRAKLFIKDIYAKTDNEATVINPYYTFKMENLSLEVHNFSISSYKYLRRLLRFSWIIRVLNRKKDVWLIGERTYKAQDTGYSFFKYMRTNHPEKNIYYVIEKDSPERDNVDPYGNVLEYRSKEHIKNTIIASKVISSHHPDYLYPLRTPIFKKKVKAVKVFLQHGVMGTKNMVANYGKKAHGFDTDVFLVSSDFEKDMIVKDFEYDPEEVYVTGLSRFDTLFENNVSVKKQLLIIPTWRDWIVTDENFLESEYYERYKNLINSSTLHDLSKKFNFKIIFCLHPNMQKFSSFFEQKNVKIINQGEIDVQHLIKESAMMITDYSSVGFDFSFLHKPIIYYQFDRDKFIGSRPSHLDLDNDLPGEIAFEKEEVLKLIEKYSVSGFVMKEKYKMRADKFINNRDQSSSERIYNVITNHTVNKKIIDNEFIVLFREALYKKFRRSKYYFPLMKLFYKIGSKLIPVDKNLILFESGIGKQLGDSPKNIYDEILKQNLNYKKVWVYNKQHRFTDANTIKISRLSPQYYFYLLRARYWVNNQNFPTYIKKRSGTTYLQTWHGTPLKKMLYDIENVQGRTDDYVERVGNAIKNWDYLISPSPYATEAFRSAFKYKGEILETGYPRNDIFYSNNNDLISKTYNRLHLPKNKKVILYAPTFRDNKTTGNNKFQFELKLNLNKMKEMLGNDYVVLLRMHVVVKNKVNIDENLADFVYDVSSYPDIQELLLITDILITDYSSVMFDFANTKKPILFFTYDLAEYRDNIRGFYMDFEKEAPGPLLFNTNEIIKSISEIDEVAAKYSSKYIQFHQKYCLLEDGNASKRVVEKVFN